MRVDDDVDISCLLNDSHSLLIALPDQKIETDMFLEVKRILSDD
jgi:hypothetical protein